MKKSRFRSVAEYRQATDAKVVTLAEQLKMSRFRVTALIYPETYPVTLRDEEVDRVAELLNQPADYVRDLYKVVKAA
jgi:hypothetical protein